MKLISIQAFFFSSLKFLTASSSNCSRLLRNINCALNGAKEVGERGRERERGKEGHEKLVFRASIQEFMLSERYKSDDVASHDGDDGDDDDDDDAMRCVLYK